MNITSYQITPTLFLNLLALALPTSAAISSNGGVDRVFVVDVSGSMAGELPAIRAHIKTRISVVAEPGDRISIVAYSGRRQCSRVLTAQDLKDASSLAAVHKAVDRWLIPIGLTAFVDPLQELQKLIAEIRGARPNAAIDVAFMSDGQETTGYSRAEIISECKKIRDEVDAAAIVEYGMWADRSLLAAMAENMGAAHVYVDGAVAFATFTEQVLTRRVGRVGKKVAIDVGADVSLVFSLGKDDVMAHAVEEGKVWVPPVEMDLAVLSSSPMRGGMVVDLTKTLAKLHGTSKGELSRHIGHAYAAVALLAVRQKPKLMFPILRSLGDTRLIDQLSCCFGKQAFTSASALAQTAAFEVKERWVGGFDQSRVPKEDAFTIVDLAKLLADGKARLDSAAIKVARIGPKLVDSADFFLQREAEEIAELHTKAGDSREVDDYTTLFLRLKSILDLKGIKLPFVADPTDNGDLLDAVVWNMERPNLSLRLRIPGTIYLGDVIPNDLPGRETLPEYFRTTIYRTRSVVAGGVRNVDMLPVFVSEEVWTKLAAEGLVDKSKGYQPRVEIDLAKVPLSNLRMAENLYARDLVEAHYNLLVNNAHIAILEDAKKQFPKENWIVEKHGAECAAWLEKNGVKPYGFSPAKAKHSYKSGDKREMRELDVKIASFSSPPSLTETRKRIAEIAAANVEVAKWTAGGGKGKAPKVPTLTPSMEVMASAIDLLTKACEACGFVLGKIPEDADIATKYKQWLEAQINVLEGRADVLRAQIANATFTAIVAQAPFSEFANQDLADSYKIELTTKSGTKLSANIVFTTKTIEL